MIDYRMHESTVRHCREGTCKKPIVFARIPSGKVAPIDAIPNPEGEYVLTVWAIDYPPGKTGPAYQMGLASECNDPTEERFTSHFKTCTKPEQFTRTKKGKR